MLCERLRETAKLYPSSPAIVWQGEAMSFEALDKRSDEIAANLTARGIGAGDIVPIELERGAEWIAYSVGIMKAGAAYAPISGALPAERREFILNDIKNATAPDGAMIYYTSGSTGVPKGVVLTHSGVMAFCEAHSDLFSLYRGVRGGVQADVGFDSFLLSTLPILYSGGTIYIMSDAERMSLVGTHRFLVKNRIDTVFMTTQLAVEYMRAFDNKCLKTLLTGGEALRAYTPRSYEVYNLYGPTECTVYVTAHKLRAGESGDIPIGAPTGKNRIYIIDGELCASGPQLAAGYLGRPEETAQKFTANPYYDPNNDADCCRLIYRTGDLAEWTDDGELLFRGRVDNQIKISGYRIEPGEVEITLAKHPDLLAVCVAVKYTPEGEPYLAAYCVPRTGDIKSETLNLFLSQWLSVYMLPRKYIMLDKLPINARTGKVDTSALPEP